MFLNRNAGYALLLAAWLASPAVLAQETVQDIVRKQPNQPTAVERSGDFVDLAPRLIPAVVNITVRLPGTESGPPRGPALPPGSPFEDFFRDFFGQREPPPEVQPRPSTAVGSGFIIDPAGYIVTNNHVTENAERVTVVLHDETQHEAKVVGRDPRTDLALLKIEVDKALPFVTWGDSEAAQIGEPVLAIGNPFGLGGSVTAGIISARARDIGVGPYDEFLQTDASINRGNSGGPLFNMRGEVIGVNTAIFSPTGGNIGIGFATPSSLALGVIQQLRENGEVRRGWIGVAIQELNEDIAATLGLQRAAGALVTEVTPESPAERAGVEIGDVILAFNGQPVEERRRLPRVVGETRMGETVPLSVWRDGQERKLEITVGDLSRAPGAAEVRQPEGTEEPRPNNRPGLGLSLAPLDRAARQQMGIQAARSGVLVASVEPGSVAAEQGLQRGDVILRVGRQNVAEPQQVHQAIRVAQTQGRPGVLMLVRRQTANRFVALPLSSS
jgi:serine protease Do